ncbi:MAG TPA: hypothetical protein VJ808_06175 [Gemmatimonadales bacterium]|nr:hypothetical protein [Gemmatimonadales bacterium]
MKDPRTTLLLLFVSSMACTTAGRAPRDPSSPTPVADPRLGPAPVRGQPTNRRDDEGERPNVPVRADQAPVVGVRDALEADSLLGRRVRVSGRCIARGEGRRAGSWTLDEAGVAIEVRGLVPSSCDPDRGEELTIFAQIEPKAPGSRDRLLLRLPD